MNSFFIFCSDWCIFFCRPIILIILPSQGNKQFYDEEKRHPNSAQIFYIRLILISALAIFVWFKFFFIYLYSVINPVLFSYFSYQPKIHYRRIFFNLCVNKIWMYAVTHTPSYHQYIHECSISRKKGCLIFFSSSSWNLLTSLGIKYMLFFM